MARQPRTHRLFDTAPPSWLPRLSLSLDEGGPDRRAQGAEPALSHPRPGGDRRRRHRAPAPPPPCLGGPFIDRRRRLPKSTRSLTKLLHIIFHLQIGRTSGRERVCQYV